MTGPQGCGRYGRGSRTIFGLIRLRFTSFSNHTEIATNTKHFMADYLTNVKTYAPNADEAAVAGIVKHCGIALQNKDASLVSCSDKAERDRVRDSFLKKKLALTLADAELDAAVVEVCQKLQGEREKQRVTFYYLLAEKFGKLGEFRK